MDGIYTKDRISINFSENEKKFSNEAVQIAKDGGNSNIKIMEASNAAFVLKEIGSATISGLQGNLYPFEDAKSGAEEALVSKMPGNSNDTANRITEDDSEALEEGGMSLERFEAERLERLLEARKAMTELKEKALEGVRADAKERRTNAEKVGKKIAFERESDKRRAEIAERLAQANLPATETNVNRIAEAMNLAGEAQHMTDASFSYLINNNLKPTIENCYVAAHTGQGGKRIVTNEAFSELKADIKKVAERAGLEKGEATENMARKLLESGAALTEANLTYYSELTELKEALTDVAKLDGLHDAILDGAVESLKNHMPPKTTNLYMVIKREEIRLELTGQSIERMRELGLEPDLEALQNRINELKNREREATRAEYFSSEEAKSDLYEETLQAVDKVEAAGESAAAFTFNSRISITLSELSVAAEQLTAGQAARAAAGAAYEAAATEVRGDLGDSIGKAFAGIDEMLKGMKLETTEANRAAVRMLGYSSLEINESSIQEMKYYAAEVRGLVDNLKPQVTAELIKRGINPLESSVRELSEKAAEIGKELGATAEERFSEYLVKLDRRKDITAEQRESYIGIYRMLYQIEKTDGAAVSALVKSGKELTLKNLLTETKSRKSRVDKNVSDELGATESVKRTEATILEQVESAYTGALLRKATEKASPERLEKIKQPKEMSLEVLSEELQALPEGEDDRAYRSERLDTFRETISRSETEKHFLTAFNLEHTAVNLEAAGHLLNDNKGYERLEKLRKEKEPESSEKLALETLPETEEELRSELEGLKGRVTELIDRLYLEAELSGREALDLRSMSRLTELTGRLANREFYDIPLQEGEEITNLHLTLLHESSEQGRFLVKLEGFRAEGSLSETELKLLISAESRENSDAIKQDQTALKGRLKVAGFSETEIYVEQGSRRGEFFEKTAETTEKQETQKLYAAAKEVVLYLRHIQKEA